MNQQMLASKIDSFWDWFLEEEENIKDFFEEEEVIDKDALVDTINERVLDFGLFRWEIGPGQRRPFYLLISPNGNAERLRLSKRIMEDAPDLPDWEFYPARPSRSDALQFRLYDNFMTEQAIDASNWQYVLLDTPTEKVDILLEAPNIAGLDEETQWVAGEQGVTNLLGEEQKIARVRTVMVVAELEEEQQEQSTPVGEMAV